MGMQLKLHMVTIEDLVPEGHFLRKLEATLDLSFVREETAHLYSPKLARGSTIRAAPRGPPGFPKFPRGKEAVCRNM